MLDEILQIAFDPAPLRAVVKAVIRRFELFDYGLRIHLLAVKRPHYGYCVYHAAQLAKRLGMDRISVIEFGVATGNGLLNLEWHAENVQRTLGVTVDVYGFDTGGGLPEPADYRDMPYHFQKGFFRMDVEALRARLERATLVLGDVRETAATFFERYRPAPIGAVMHDFDFYSSTVPALAMFDAAPEYWLPRVFCYFDDTIGAPVPLNGTPVELYNDYTGQRLAIHDFNAAHEHIKLSPAYHLISRKVAESWFHQIWTAHLFRHPLYNAFVSKENELKD